MGPRVPSRRQARITVVAWALLLAAPAPAGAVVSDVRLIDGPATELQAAKVDAAMSEDGTGGVVYLKNIDGHDHVFATQFRDGAWGAPQRVDVDQDFDSSWPQIGAGDGGRLVVTWAQEFGVDSDRMYSATLDPGANGFQTPVPIDFDVNEATATYPDLAMNRGGQAYLVYDVVTDTSPSNPSGYEGVDVRVAHYSNRLWSLFDSPIDRNSTVPMSFPTEANHPRVGIDVQGQGVVAWQEPDDEFVDRIWARRLFDTRTGVALAVSPSTWEDEPLRGVVDGFGLDVSGFGQAAVAIRQQPGEASALTAPRLFVNEMPEVYAEGADDFGDPILADGEARAGLGSPSVAVDANGMFLVGFGSGAAAMTSAGDGFEVSGVERIDSGESSVEPEPLVDLAETGASVAAWRELRGSTGVVGVREHRADGVTQSTAVSAPSGGSIGPLSMGGSGLGDAIIAWRQGTGSNAQIAANVVDAPPDSFLVLLPDGWQRKRKVSIAWDRTQNAVGGLTYSVSVDDEPVIEGVKRTKAKLKRDDVDDGSHRIQVFAVDDLGQETGSRKGRLFVDRTAPKANLARRGRRLTVTVSDGRKGEGSGLKGTVRISFGDGSSKRVKASKGAFSVHTRHRFKRRGTYSVAVTARDRAKNATTVRRKVRAG